MRLIKKYINVNLILRISIGIIFGIIFGLLVTIAQHHMLSNDAGYAVTAKFLTGLNVVLVVFGKLFIGALRGVAPVLVFFLVATSLMRSRANQGKTIRNQIFLYIFGTFFAAFTAFAINMIAQVQLVLLQGVDTSSVNTSMGMSDIIFRLFDCVVTNPLAAIADGNYLAVLFWSILFGIAVRNYANEGFKHGFITICNGLTAIVKGIIEFAPFGIGGLVYTAIMDSGLAIFIDYGKLLLVYIACVLSVVFIFNPLIVFAVLRRNPYPLVWKTITRSGVTAFFFRSSAANIPINMELCKELGLDEDNYSISIPLGATINMEGAAITIITLTLSCCFALGLHIDFGSGLILCLIATISAAGASGVSGGSILLVPMACSLFGIGGDIAAAVVSVGFIIGVVQDSLETALNSSTDVLFTSTIQFSEKIKAGKPLHSVVAKKGEKVFVPEESNFADDLEKAFTSESDEDKEVS